MSMNEEEICRLCFNITGNDFIVIDDIMKEILEVLLLNLEINIIESPIICQTCAAFAERSFYFKSLCIDTQELIGSFAVSKDQTVIELKDIFEGDNTEETFINQDFSICRFCMNHSEKNNFVSINNLMNEQIYLEMLSKCISEMDLGITRNPLICTFCRENIEGYFKFVRNCLDTENKINTLHTTKLSTLDCRRTNALDSHRLTYRAASQAKMYKCAVCPFITKYERSLKRHIVTHRPPCQIKMYKCTLCTYTTKQKNNLDSYMLTHRPSFQLKKYNCALCTYNTNRKCALDSHMLTHRAPSEEKVYKCNLCPLTTKSMSSLISHTVTHRAPSQVKMYKCALCTHTTKRKNSLQSHMLTHKAASQVRMCKCDICPRMTRWKRSFKHHMLTHRTPS